MLVAAVWAPQILHFEGIVEYFQSFLGHLTMPVVVVFLGGLFWRRATRHACFATLIVGIPIGLAAFLTGEVFGVYDFQFLYATGVMFAFSAALFVTVSLLSTAPDEQRIRETSWSRRHWQEESAELRGKPLWKNYRVQSLVIAAITLVMIWLFR